ncbi:hypothetical protein EZV62_014974 [Acer yangbiense]|uniref:Reverse transcriptase Ty1/copia-type domain-containing protein n=1 Tax=Acer yangbiense TaxID=1000413 RepID=A0A5C7HTJ7_9ROSI|nr:hypothetical protein EZV62_014974 [Acer yangbiense]
MKDLGAAKQILGMRISRDEHEGTLKLSQAEYVPKVLQRFSMGDTKSEANTRPQFQKDGPRLLPTSHIDNQVIAAADCLPKNDVLLFLQPMLVDCLVLLIYL